MANREAISIFHMLKIGVGPSSSHTLGPWRAAQRWIEELKEQKKFDKVTKVQVDLYGSLSLTGKGHATDLASLLGLSGYDPVTIPIESIDGEIAQIKSTGKLLLNGEKPIEFSFKDDVIFNRNFKKFHPNGMRFSAVLDNQKTTNNSFYSIGGGFVVKEERKRAKKK